MLFKVDILACIKAFWKIQYMSWVMFACHHRFSSWRQRMWASSSCIAWTAPHHCKLCSIIESNFTFLEMTQNYTGLVEGASPQWSLSSSWWFSVCIVCHGWCLVWSLVVDRHVLELGSVVVDGGAGVLFSHQVIGCCNLLFVAIYSGCVIVC